MCYVGVTSVLRRCYVCATKVLRRCYEGVTQVLLWLYRILVPTMMFSSSLSDGMGSDEEPREEDEDLKLVSSKLSDSSLRLGSEGSLRLLFWRAQRLHVRMLLQQALLDRQAQLDWRKVLRDWKALREWMALRERKAARERKALRERKVLRERQVLRELKWKVVEQQ
jgi:hypothetical protein